METLIFFVLSSFRARGKSRNVSVLVAFTLHVGPHASDKNCNPYLIIALWLWLWRGWLKTQGLFIGGHREASTALRAATSQWLPEETSARSLVIFSSSSFVGYFSRLRVSSKRFSWFYETQSQSHPPKSSYLVTLVIPKSQTKNFLRLLGPLLSWVGVCAPEDKARSSGPFHGVGERRFPSIFSNISDSL